MMGRNLSKLGLTFACLLLAMPARAAVVDVTGTSAKLGWTAASGSVATYGVFVSKNGAAFSATPTQVVTLPEVTVSGATGDTLVVKVAAYDAAGTKGPDSVSSDSVHFIAVAGPPPPPPPAPPAMTVSSAGLTLSVVQGLNAASQSFTVRNTGGGTLNYLTAYSHDWIVLSAASGTATTETDTIGVSFATSTLPAGTYAGTITVMKTDAPAVESYIPVSLTVTAPPVTPPAAALGVSASALTATAQKGQSPAAQSFTVQNTGGGTLSYAVASSASWLTVSPGSGTSTGESDSIGLSFNTTSLGAGSYSANITVSATGLASKTIPVTLTINAPPAALSVAPASLTASAQKGQSPAAQSFTVQNTGGGALSYAVASSASWLTVSPASGASTGESDSIGLSFNTTSLAAGSYSANITVSASGVPSATIPVSLTITALPAALGVSASALTATAQKGQSPAAQGFTVQNTGGGTLSYAVAESASWLSLSPASGTSTGESDSIGVSFATTSLAAGSYSANITVSATGLASKTIPVTLTVSAAPAALSVAPASLSASVQKGQSPAAQSFTVQNTGGGTLSYAVAESASWLSLSPASGTSTGESDSIGVSFATTSLAAGSYSATITVSASGVPSATIPVSLTVTNPPASLSVSPAVLNVSVAKGQNAYLETFTVQNTGGGTVSYSLSEGSSWLSITPFTGTSTGESDSISVLFNTTALKKGSYSAPITVSAPGAATQVVTVNLTVTDTAPSVGVSTTSLSATAQKGQDAVPTSFSVSNTGGGTLAWTATESASWLSLSAASGSSTGESDSIDVSYATASLAPGTYNATITVSGGAGVASKTIAVSLTVDDLPASIALSTASLSATANQGQDAASANFSVRNAGGGTLSYSVAEAATWLSVSPASGTSTGENDSIGVSYSTASLGAGTYNATITVSGGSGVAPQTLSVAVTVNEPAPAVALSTTSLSTTTQSGHDASPASFTVRNAGGGMLSYAVASGASWLSVTPATGTSAGESDTIGVQYATSGLNPGSYSAAITVNGAGAASKTVAVSVTVSAAAPVLELSTASIDATANPGQNTANQSFTVRNAGGGSLDYAVVSDQSWVTVSPASGSSTGEADTLTLSFSTKSLTAGQHQARLTVSAAGLAPKTVAVSVRIGTASVRFDLDGDGRSDALFRHADGSLAAWLVNGTKIRSSVSPSSLHFSWSLVATGDFDGDGKSLDVVWLDPTTGGVMIALNDGKTLKGLGSTGVANKSWKVGGVADFDGDGKSDILWLDPATGNATIWLVSHYGVKDSRIAGTVGAGWSVGATGDFDGDHKADVFFEKADTQERVVWMMNGLTVRQSLQVANPLPGSRWSAMGAGDFNADGKGEILAQDTSFGAVNLLTWNGAGFTRLLFIGIIDPSAALIGTGDYDGDGHADLLWYDPSGGDVSVWLFDGNDFVATELLGNIDSTWTAVGETGTAH